jgi:outer membrane protein assembly factor BamB
MLAADDYVITGTGRGDLVNADPHAAGAVIKMNRFNGEVAWRTDLADAVLGQIALDDGKVFCPVRNGTVVALDVRDGQKLWSQTISDAPMLGGITCAGRNLYAVSSDGFLVILDATTGDLLEKHSLNDETNSWQGNLSLSTPIVSEGRVYVGSETGGMRCFVGTHNE